MAMAWKNPDAGIPRNGCRSSFQQASNARRKGKRQDYKPCIGHPKSPKCNEDKTSLRITIQEEVQ